jgi:hypothetical protein
MDNEVLMAPAFGAGTRAATMSVDHSQFRHQSDRPLLARVIVVATLIAFGCFVAALDQTLWAGSAPAPAYLALPLSP